ncbi:B12-binding domain-containing protein [Singulisphaera sp. PoT]|uniref:cobalamin B12-binding domain-containing protein n=1 Tax=Singulisphaera sp. PoT TaxID=3411797 RepID=UPI003BF563C9
MSESSLKRWCDQGLIKVVRTGGGHRKIAVPEVLRFALEHGHVLKSPEVLGLPPSSEQSGIGLAQARPRLVESLLGGDELVVRQIVFDLYLAKHALSVIFDQVIASAFRIIGERWECNEVDVYQERRACEITLRTLFELRRNLPDFDARWTAVGGTLEGDHYALPSAMAELVLLESGYHATSMGTSIPIESLVNSVHQEKPRLFWLSVSHIRDDYDLVGKFSALSEACMASGTALVVGGRALTDDLRHRMNYSAYGDTMQHLEGFARALLRSSKGGEPSYEPGPRTLGFLSDGDPQT